MFITAVAASRGRARLTARATTQVGASFVQRRLAWIAAVRAKCAELWPFLCMFIVLDSFWAVHRGILLALGLQFRWVAQSGSNP